MPASKRSTASLARALGVQRRGVHAFVGAGGKTAAIRRLLAERPGGVATTTTHLGPSGFGHGLLAVFSSPAELEAATPDLLHTRPLTLALGGRVRLQAPPLAWHQSFSRAHAKLLLLVEADGAARHLVKRPGAGEPAWPPGPLARAVIVVGLAALGRPADAVAHHPERFGSRTVGRADVERLLSAYLDAAPPRAAISVLFTGAASVAPGVLEALVRRCEQLVRGRDGLRHDPGVPLRVVAADDLTSGLVHFWDFGRGREVRTPVLPGVCGVLLAAGRGRRYAAQSNGADKLLARWRGRTLVEHATSRFAAAGFAALVVVTGHRAAAIEPLVRRAARRHHGRVRIVRNRAASRGLGTSVRAGARAAPAGMGLLFGHADMPAVGVPTLRRVAALGSALVHRIVIPTVGGAPRNPAYFPAVLRAELARVPASSGGKSVAAAHGDRIFHLDMGSGADLLDVDHAEDLAALERRRAAGASRTPRWDQRRTPRVLLVGAGDLGTGVAVALVRAGFEVGVVELARPRAVRRRVALAEAARTGRSRVEGVTCRRHTLAALRRSGWRRDEVALVVAPVRQALAALRPDVLVDARLAKKRLPFPVEASVFHVALGPGHRAGEDCDAVVETLRGPALGSVIWRGAAAADTGVPGHLGGVAAERVLRAPARGVLRVRAGIGRSVRRGDIVARVGGRDVRAQVDGIVRGMLAAGDRVSRGQKLGDVDPRPAPPPLDRISDKASTVGLGVLQALRAQFGTGFRSGPGVGPTGTRSRLRRSTD